MREPYDTSLEALLADTLARQGDRIEATVTIDRVHARLEERRRIRRRASIRKPLMLLGVAAAVLLPLAALVASQRSPEPQQMSTGPYEALIRRSDGAAWSVVALRGDGQERVIASVPIPDPSSDRRRPMMDVSAAGWLATPGSTGWEFQDLHSQDAAIGPITPYLASETGHAWIGDGRFAAWNEAGQIVLLDPVAGTVQRASVPGPLTNVVAWTSDGTALVTYGDWGHQIVYFGERRSPDWHVIPIAGGPTGGSLSDLALGGQAGGWWRPDGSRVQLCDMAVRMECPGLPNGAVIVESPAGALTTWYRNELAPDDVIDATFGGTGIWLLLDQRVAGRQAVLARLDTPGTLRTVSVWESGSLASGQGAIEGVAPDDSLVVVSSTAELMVDAVTGGVTPIDGSLLGFVPAAAADTWVGQPFQAAPDRSVAPIGSTPPSPYLAYPTLPPMDDLIRDQMAPGDRVLWREERTAVDGPAASPYTVEIGPIQLGEGIGVMLQCSGPSDVLVSMERPDASAGDNGPLTPLLSRCLDGAEVAGGYAPAAQIDGPVRFSVTAASDTAWRVVIFDPAPGQ